MHIISPENGVWGVVPIVAGTISLATGAAMAAKIQKKDQVIVSFFGDGATGEGVLYESLNLASLLQLPILYVCENNFYSTHMPLRECRRRDNIVQTGLPFGIRGVRLDGNDVLEVYKASQKAVSQCRAGKGPVFMECVTYRMRGHVGADDNVQGSHTDIRPPEEVERWRRRDPLSRFEKVLSKAGVSKERIQKIRNDSSEEVARAHAFAHESPSPVPRDLGCNVFDAEGVPCPL